MIPQLIEDLKQQGIDVSKGIPTGITRNANGDAILYFKGTELEPKYLMEVDTLIGRPLTWDEIRNDYRGLGEETEYFNSFDWDTTEAGFVDILNRNNQYARHYFTMHQPTGSKVWYRKIQAETVKGVIVKLWEKFDKDNWDCILKDGKEQQLVPINVIDV